MELEGLVRPEWPPLAHIRRGWQALSLQERAEVEGRVKDVMARLEYGEHARPDALRHFFAFLAQVETIAIEIPLRYLTVAPENLKPLLRQQLVDEVFHSTLFARLAHELALPDAQPGKPLQSAERLLDRIRAEEDLAVSATMLNLVAEGWIENLFEHALKWGIADAVFEAVLEDESRHVHEAEEYIAGLDARAATKAVHTLEQGLMEVSGEPTVGLSIMDLAGEDAYQALVEDLWTKHRKHLELAGVKPSPAWSEMETLARDTANMLIEQDRPARAQPVDDTPWRRAARRVWETPRDPTMQGEFDVEVGHVPKKLLTPVIVAAIGKAWAANPRLNRIIQRDRVYALPGINVGVRVLVADDELATVVIPDADKRSVKDISRMIIDGYKQLEATRKRRIAGGHPPMDPVPDDVMAMAPVSPLAFSVALSNPGKFGMVAGGGAFSGALAPSTDLSVGQRRRLPVWKGVFVPKWHVNFGALQDHRLFDGKEAGIAMTALRASLSKKSVKEILRRPDTLEETEEPDYDRDWDTLMPPSMRMLSVTGFYKWVPVTIGGLGLAALAGAGAVALYSHLNEMNAASQQQQQVVVVQGSLDDDGNIVLDDGPIIEPLRSDGQARCRIMGDEGQCEQPSMAGRFSCLEHVAEPAQVLESEAEEAGLLGIDEIEPPESGEVIATLASADGDSLDAAAPDAGLEATLADGRDRCQALKKDGDQCGFAAKTGAFCGRHA